MKTSLRKSSVFVVLILSLVECGLADQTDDAISKIKSQIREIDSQTFKNDSEIRSSNSKEQSSDIDLMLGHFCSECGLTKGEIESHGENFEEHLKHVNGKEVAATYDQRKSKRQEFENQRNQLESRNKDLKDQRKTLEQNITDLERARAEGKKAERDNEARIDAARDAQEKADRDQMEKAKEDEKARIEADRKARQAVQDQMNSGGGDGQGIPIQRSTEETADVRARNEARQKEIDRHKATRDKMIVVRDHEIPAVKEDVNGYGDQGNSHADMARVAGIVQGISGAGRVAGALLPPGEKELVDLLQQGGDVIVDAHKSLIKSGQGNAYGAIVQLGEATANGNQVIDDSFGGTTNRSVQKKLDGAAKVLSVTENVANGDYGAAAGDVASGGISMIKDEKKAGKYGTGLKGAQAIKSFSNGETAEGVKGVVETAYDLGNSRIPESMRGYAGKIVDSLGGVVDTYKGVVQFSDATDEKHNILERRNSTQKTLDAISDRLTRRIQTEQDIIDALCGQLEDEK